jgi:Bifunctional DNA primase/polymerase, N-terminal
MRSAKSGVQGTTASSARFVQQSLIEVDGPHGQSILRPFPMPPTPTVMSHRGPHHYVKIPPGYSVKTTHLEELDIIGDGDQVVGPGSIHRSGHLYHWHDYLSLEDIAPVEPPKRSLHGWSTAEFFDRNC